MYYRTAQYSMKGGRSYNEDSVRCENSSDIFIAVVADGLGGHGGGELASRTVVDSLISEFMIKPDIDADSIRGLFESANRKILSLQTPSLQMKSTGAALFCSPKRMAAAHVGDSRIYRFQDGSIVFQTKDHSVSQMAVLSGEIPPSGIRFNEDRNRVLRAFGGDIAIKPEISFFDGGPRSSDAFLLCTDGFWEYVLEEEMEIDLAKSQTPDQWLDFMTARLGKRVNGKNDNFTAAAVFVMDAEGPVKESPSEVLQEITVKEW